MQKGMLKVEKIVSSQEEGRTSGSGEKGVVMKEGAGPVVEGEGLVKEGAGPVAGPPVQVKGRSKKVAKRKKKKEKREGTSL